MNVLRPGAKIKIKEVPYEVVKAVFNKPGKGQASTKTKLRNLLTGKIIDKTFKGGDDVVLADIHEKKLRYTYSDQDEAVFMDEDAYEVVGLSKELVEPIQQWLVEDLEYTALIYEGNVVGVDPPMFLDLKVIESPPAVRGDTVSGRVLKEAVLETGAKVQVPIFIQEGETIKVDTRTSEYVARSSK